MIEKIAADAVLLLHLSFVLFVVFGGVAVLCWPRLAWAHVPTALWGIYVEVSGSICPLTTIENRLRSAAGGAGYEGGFIDQYITPVLYPPGLTRPMQLWLAVAIVAINGALYARLIYTGRRGS